MDLGSQVGAKLGGKIEPRQAKTKEDKRSEGKGMEEEGKSLQGKGVEKCGEDFVCVYFNQLCSKNVPKSFKEGFCLVMKKHGTVRNSLCVDEDFVCVYLNQLCSKIVPKSFKRGFCLVMKTRYCAKLIGCLRIDVKTTIAFLSHLAESMNS